MKFSIRDLFLVTLIVALALGWIIERRALRERNDRLLDANSELTWRTEALVEASDEIGYTTTFDDWYGLNVEDKHKPLPFGLPSSPRIRPDIVRIPRAMPNPRALPTSQAPAPNPPKP